ncbi:MAG: hypothetical protein HY974_04720 [Candidatus Kerfeldbacteria bacterium]|nr:hypothetical protein [Candidatus Kerfeldbacteria bacterium]
MTNQNGQNGFCRECGAPTTVISRTPPGWGQQPQSVAVCSVNQLHNIKSPVNLETLRLAHNNVVVAQAGPDQDKKESALRRLANLMALAAPEVLQAYCREMHPDKAEVKPGVFC